MERQFLGRTLRLRGDFAAVGGPVHTLYSKQSTIEFIQLKSLSSRNIYWDYNEDEDVRIASEKLKESTPKQRLDIYIRVDGETYPLVYNRRDAKVAAEEKLLDQMTQTLCELRVFPGGMPITQENGQRRYGPPSDYTGKPPEKGSEVFIGKLPRELSETDLVPLFSKAGKIYELRLMMDFGGTNRGYCFVQYYSTNDANKAITLFNEFEVRPGKRLGVVKSVDNCRLFIGGIPRDKTKEDICDEIKSITEGVVKVIANPTPGDRSKNRGYAFVEYDSHRSAAMARRKLLPGKIAMFGVPIAVDWAEPEPDVDPSIMSKVTNLYIRNLTAAITEDEIRDLFNTHSENGVDKVKKIKDYAFVHLESRSQAQKAMNELDGYELDGVPMEITWAKPVNRVAYKARKEMAKQLYSIGNNGKLAQSAPGYEVRESTSRIFGQYGGMAATQHHNQFIYQAPQFQQHQQQYPNHQPYQALEMHHHHQFQYQGGPYLPHDLLSPTPTPTAPPGLSMGYHQFPVGEGSGTQYFQIGSYLHQ